MSKSLPNSSQQRALGLELLRFILAFAVVAYHYLFFGPKFGYIDGDPQFFEPLVYGRFGVPVFFIISGFVITLTTRGRTWRTFAIARFARLFPALAICSTITYLSFLIASDDAPLNWITWFWIKTLSFVGVAWGGYLIDPSYWSLVYEWRFYIAIGLLLFLGKLTSAILLTTVISVLAIALEVFVSTSIDLRLLLFPFLPFFTIGMVFYERREAGATPRLVFFLTLNIVLAIGGIYFDLVDFKGADFAGHKLFLASVLIPILSIILFWGALELTMATRFAKLATALGAASYPLYLLHQTTGYFLINALQSIGIGQFAATAIVAAAIIGVSLFIAARLEPPISQALKTRLTSD